VKTRTDGAVFGAQPRLERDAAGSSGARSPADFAHPQVADTWEQLLQVLEEPVSGTRLDPKRLTAPTRLFHELTLKEEIL
jgi:hypothetical protein